MTTDAIVSNGEHILLVEDEAIIAIAEAAQLERVGYKVTHALSGEESLVMIEEDPDFFQLVLMDIDLGESMDGAETASRILRQHHLPIVFLSSHSEKEIVGLIHDLPTYGYVDKNSGTPVLLASVRMALRLFAANSMLEESRKMLSAVVNSTSDMIWSVGPVHFELITFNEAMEQYILRNRSVKLRKGLLPENLITPGEYAEVSRSYYRKALENGHFQTEHIVYERTRILSLTFTVLETGGKIFGISAFGKDITDIRERETRLKLAEEKFRSAFLLSATPMIIVDITDRAIIVDSNNAVLNASGFNRDDLVSRTIEESRIFVNHDQFEQMVVELRERNRFTDRHCLLRSKNGAIVPRALSGELINVGGTSFALITALPADA
ncbi:MAG TPA: response regulator [Spirochaetia bacterium]|nr:response regulator [Spirochaetia bacterium]